MKKFLLSIFAVMLAVFSVQAQEVTFDFTKNTWGFPSGSSNKTAATKTYSNEGYSITVAGGGSSNGHYFNTDGYLLNGKSGATLTFPVFDFAVSKIEVVGKSGASSSTAQNIYVGTTAVSTETKGSAGTNVYEIAEAYQAAGNVYILKISSGHNAQYTKINIYKAEDGETQDPEEPVVPEEPETPTTSEIVATYELTQENMASEWSGTTSYENKTIECSYGSWTGYFNFTKSGTTYTLGLNGSANLQSPVSYGAVKSVSIVITNSSSSARNIVLTGESESKTISVPSKTTTEIVFDGFETEFYCFTLTASGALQISSIEVVCPPSYTLSVSDAGWATMFLGFDAEIVYGAKAYIVKTEGVSADKVTLTEITGTIPANTGVIVKAEQGVYEFNYSAENVADVTGNLLSGSAYDKNIEEEAYVLSNVGGVVGLYKAEMNQLEGTAWLNNANKAYLPASAVPNKTAEFYGFDWDGTTGIDEITENREQSTVIYDLTGRRVEAITAPGIYIVNGKKTLVK